MDDPAVPKEALFQNLRELETINKYLGGHAVSLKGLEKIIADQKKNPTIVDIGCGGGDALKSMAAWGKRKRYQFKLTGADLKEDCISFARKNCKEYPEIDFVPTDFRNIFTQLEKGDIVHASLFFHHFRENDIISFIKLCSENKVRCIINDLERNPIAYYSIKWITQLFSNSYLVKNDAPLSVLRGFKKKEWQQVLKAAGIKKYSIENKWAFRHLIIIYPNE